MNAAYGGPLPPCQKPGKVGDGVCDAGNNNLGCEYDGGDCCLPQARDRDCIDPCGVRLKFFGGKNSKTLNLFIFITMSTPSMIFQDPAGRHQKQ